MLENMSVLCEAKEYIGDCRENIKCPHCGESYYMENYSMCTAMAWTPIYKNGVLQNSNPNTTTTFCTCMNCGKNFEYER